MNSYCLLDTGINDMCFFDSEKNITNVIFDDKLKQFINETRSLINSLYPLTDMGNVPEKQSYFIKYVKQNKHRLNWLGPFNLKPDMFALNIAMMCNIDSFNRWSEIEVQEIITKTYMNISHYENFFIRNKKRPKYVVNHGLEEDENYRKDIQSVVTDCCCGKNNINPENIMFSQTDFYSVHFGSCCWKKISIRCRDFNFARALYRTYDKKFRELSTKKSMEQLKLSFMKMTPKPVIEEPEPVTEEPKCTIMIENICIKCRSCVNLCNEDKCFKHMTLNEKHSKLYFMRYK